MDTAEKLTTMNVNGLSGISSSLQMPIAMDKQHIFCLKPLKLAFLQFKEQVPFIFENKISAVQCEMKAL